MISASALFAPRPIALAVALGASLFASACRHEGMSYDVINGPENVLGAPLFDSVANRQQYALNGELYRRAVRDSVFFVLRAERNTKRDSGSATPAVIQSTPQDNGAGQVPIMSNNER